MRSSLFVIVFLVFSAYQAFSQGLNFGVKAGPNLSKVRDEFVHTFESGLNFQAGGFGEWYLPIRNNNISFRTEVEVSKNFSVDIDSPSIRYDFWLMSVPFYLSFGEGDSPYRLYMGAKFSKFISGEVEFREDYSTDSIVFDPLIVSFSFGLVYAYNERWALQFNYDFGKTNFYVSRVTDRLYNNSLQVSLNYTLIKNSKSESPK